MSYIQKASYQHEYAELRKANDCSPTLLIQVELLPTVHFYVSAKA